MLNFTATAYEATKHPFGEAPETKNEVIGKTEFAALNVNAAQAYIDTQVFSEGRASLHLAVLNRKAQAERRKNGKPATEAGTYRRRYTLASNRDYCRTIVIIQKPTTETAVEAANEAAQTAEDIAEALTKGPSEEYKGETVYTAADGYRASEVANEAAETARMAAGKAGYAGATATAKYAREAATNAQIAADNAYDAAWNAEAAVEVETPTAAEVEADAQVGAIIETALNGTDAAETLTKRQTEETDLGNWEAAAVFAYAATAVTSP